MSQLESAGRTPSSSDDLSFSPLRPSTDCMRPTHITEGSLLYSWSVDLNVTFILELCSQQHPHVCIQISGHHGLTQLTREINHHKWLDKCYFLHSKPYTSRDLLEEVGASAEMCLHPKVLRTFEQLLSKSWTSPQNDTCSCMQNCANNCRAL